MDFEFDTAPSGKGHFTQKWDDMAPLLGVTADDAIPMWVADMDFRAAPCIRAALQADLDRGFMGYFAQTERVSEAVTAWMSGKHRWAFDASALRYSHGVVAGFATAVDAFSDPGDSVVLFSPVYHSFYGKLRALGRSVLESPLVLKDGRFEMDLDDLATTADGARADRRPLLAAQSRRTDLVRRRDTGACGVLRGARSHPSVRRDPHGPDLPRGRAPADGGRRPVCPAASGDDHRRPPRASISQAAKPAAS